jgi:hypothetical protein
MNLGKKMIACAAIAISLFTASSAKAQMRGDTAAMRQRQEAMLQKMTDDLKLTPVQADSIKAISKDLNGKRREIFMDQSLSREDKMAKMQPLQDESNKRVKAVLGDDLFKKYQDWMEANRPQRGPGGGGPRQQ